MGDSLRDRKSTSKIYLLSGVGTTDNDDESDFFQEQKQIYAGGEPFFYIHLVYKNPNIFS